MANVKDLLQRLEQAEHELSERHFLAPCARGGQVRTSLAGLIYTFVPRPRDFAGWGIFKPCSETEVCLVEEADFMQISEYLRLFPALRVRLAFPLGEKTRLAFPINESDVKQRFFKKTVQVAPIAVHLTTEGSEFEVVIVRLIGNSWFFEEIDRRAAPEDAENLQNAWRAQIQPDALNFKNLTPEMRVCYSLIFNREQILQERQRERWQRWQQKQQTNDEQRLRDALQFGGGSLENFVDRGEFWLVEWTARDGEQHSSAIAKDLTVVSAGICLSGEDAKFDLQSLVGVVEGWNGQW